MDSRQILALSNPSVLDCQELPSNVFSKILKGSKVQEFVLNFRHFSREIEVDNSKAVQNRHLLTIFSLF